YGVPAAVAASIAYPQRRVVSFAGDGCMLMNGQELATAKSLGLKPLIIILNNSMYGTIRRHQENRCPGRIVGTSLANPDFAAYANAFGFVGRSVERNEVFEPMFVEVLRADSAGLIEIRLSEDLLT